MESQFTQEELDQAARVAKRLLNVRPKKQANGFDEALNNGLDASVYSMSYSLSSSSPRSSFIISGMNGV